MDRLDQRGMHALRIIGGVGRPHAGQQVDDLLGRVGEELRDHLDGADRCDDGGDDDEVDGETGEPLRRRETAPDAVVGELGHGVQSSSGRRSWRAPGAPWRRRNRSPIDAPSMNIARTPVASSSPSMISAMIEIRIAQTKS